MQSSSEERELLPQRLSRRRLLKAGAAAAIGAAGMGLAACAGENEKGEVAMPTAASRARPTVTGPPWKP